MLNILSIIIFQGSELIHIKKKTLTFHNPIILIKWVIDKNKNNSYFNIYLEEANQQANQKTEIFANIGIS